MKKGFTLLEFIVVISIFSILSSVVLFNYNSYTRNIELSSAVQDMALQVKDAQTSALNGRFPVLRADQNIPISFWQPAYGLLFSRDDPTTIAMFYDYNSNDLPDPVTTSTGTSLKNNFCGATGTECLSYLSLSKGEYISKIYADAGGIAGQCTQSVSIVFRRPFPDAIVRFNVIEGVNVAAPIGSTHIQITGPSGSRFINISPIGQISTDSNGIDPCPEG